MVIDLSLRQLNGVLLVRSAQQQKLNAYGQIIRLGPNAIGMLFSFYPLPFCCCSACGLVVTDSKRTKHSEAHSPGLPGGSPGSSP